MNHLERLLCASEKTVKLQAKDINILKQLLADVKQKVEELEIQNFTLQNKIENDIVIESEFKRENQFLEADRNNLLEQLKSQHQFILAINDLQQKSVFNKMRVVQELTLTQKELASKSQELLRYASENAELKSQVQELQNKNTQLNNKVAFQLKNIERDKNKFEDLLKDRDQILMELQERISQLECRHEQHFIEQQEMIELEVEESQLTENSKDIEEDLNIAKQKYEEQQQTITLLKQQILEKEQLNIDLQSKILEYQQTQSKQQSLLTSNEIEKAMPMMLKQQVQQLKQLKMIFPQMVQKISRLEINQQEIFTLKKQLKDQTEGYQQLQTKYQTLTLQHSVQIKENKVLLSELEQVIEENWEIKKYLLNQFTEEELLEFLESLKAKLNFTDYPFENFEELLTTYNKMKDILNKQAEQQHSKQM